MLISVHSVTPPTTHIKKKSPKLTVSASLQFDPWKVMGTRGRVKMGIEKCVHQSGFANARLSCEVREQIW